jgi:hypothetical protein
MTFNVLFLALAPEAEPEKHSCMIEMSQFKLVVAIVRNRNQAIKVCNHMIEEEDIHSVILCPGFTHRDVAVIAEELGSKVSVSVARGDGPSNKVVAEARKKAGLE